MGFTKRFTSPKRCITFEPGIEENETVLPGVFVDVLVVAQRLTNETARLFFAVLARLYEVVVEGDRERLLSAFAERHARVPRRHRVHDLRHFAWRVEIGPLRGETASGLGAARFHVRYSARADGVVEALRPVLSDPFLERIDEFTAPKRVEDGLRNECRDLVSWKPRGRRVLRKVPHRVVKRV